MSSQHTDVAAYSLGLLEPTDRLEFEEHLAGCASCQAELAELAGMSALLAGVDPVSPEREAPDDAGLAGLMRRRADARRRGFRTRAVLAAAACLALVAGGVAAGLAAAPGGPSPLTSVVGQRHTARNAATGITATVGLVGKAWGTQVTMDLAGVRGPLYCQLVAVSRTGERRVIAGWFVPAAGYGVPGHPAHLILAGGTAIAENQLASVEVDVLNGRTLVRIPV